MKNKLHFVTGDLLSAKSKKINTTTTLKQLTKKMLALLLIALVSSLSGKAQAPSMSDMVLYSGNGSGTGVTAPYAPGAGVIVGCNSAVNGASIGSKKLIKTTGPATLSTQLISNETVDLAANCVLTGKISAANQSAISGTVVSVGTAATLGGNIDANGNIVVAGGNVYATVTHPSGTTYSGPLPGGGNVVGAPSLALLPAPPSILTFPASNSTAITSTQTINPGSYGNMNLAGGKTITLNGTGDYIFNTVLNSGDNNLVFNFNNSTSGVFRIFIHGDADFGQIHASLLNGGSASRIYTEVHGNGASSSNGTYSFVIANCTAAIKSSWLGTVWAPYAAIKIGSLSGGTDISGALWSGSQVNVRCGVTITSVPYNPSLCASPNANAGADKVLTCSVTSVQLNGSSSTSNVSYNWVASNGGNIVSGANTASPMVNAAGTYTLTVTTNTGSCTATDVAIVTSNTNVPNANAGADKQLTCTTLSTILNGSSTSTGVTYNWIASGGGNIVSGANTASPTVNAAGTYTLVVTQTSNGCTATDQAIVTYSGGLLPNANAGPDKVLTCTTTSVQLNGSSTSTSVSYSWVASNGGNIVSGASTATPLVNAAGTYTLTVTALAGGCTKTDVALVTSNTALPNANAGADKTLTCTTTSVQLSGSSTTSGVSYLWTASNGGNITSGSNTATPTVNAAGTYTLKVTNTSTGCFATDQAIVTFNGTLPNANAGADKQLTCAVNSVQLNGSSTSTGITYSWAASNGGNIVSGANTATPTVNAAGTYTLTVTKTSGGCTKTDVALVTMNNTAPNVSAGNDVELNCTVKSANLLGSTSTAGAIYSWAASNGGHIVSGASTLTPLIDGVGDYTLTVLNPSNGCSASDVAKGTKGCIFLYYPDDSISTTSKTDSVIGSELTSLNKYFKIYNPDTTGNIFRLAHDSVWIEVIALNGYVSTLTALLQSPAYGMTNIVTHEIGSLIITGKFPIKNLLKLNSLYTYIDYCRPLYPPILSNSIISQGDTSMRGMKARTGFGLSGEGVKVGIISDSYNKKSANPAALDVANGNLPGAGNPDNNLSAVQVIRDLDFTGSDEGRAMAQIVHDVAPKADLAFRTGFIDANDFALGIKELQQNSCNVIVDDVTYITEPFFQDGVVANAVNDVTALGVSYFTAAGNFGGQSYTGTFTSAPLPATIVGGSAHNFGGGDVLQKIAFPRKGAYTIVLQWEDGVYSLGQFTGTQNDLDIYLTDDAGNILVSYNRNNLGRDPIEVLPISVSTTSAKANLLIVRAAGSAPVKFKYIVYTGKVKIEEYASADSSTIVGHANSVGSITVAASYYKTTPAYGVSPAQIEDYSSVGGNLINNVNRNKPDITAPDGGYTSVLFGGANNFFGTSAAAPHAAGVAALMLQARSKFYSQSLTPSDVKSTLKSTALSMAPNASAKQAGSGLIQGDAAILTFASAKPNLFDLVVPNAVIPGTQAFTVTINGEYITSNSKVLLNGVQLPTTVISSSQLSASVPVFTGNPAIQVNNPPTVPNNNDGGLSNKLYFTPLKKVIVRADNTSKRYGEALPLFTHSITVDGVPLSATGLSLSDIGLSNLQDSTSASTYSPALNSYYIRPYRVGGFNALNPADSVLLSKYEYTFVEGSLKINKLPLKITANDTTLVYGSKIDGQQIHYTYSYDDSKIAASEKLNFDAAIKADHLSLLSDAVGFIDGKVANGFGRVVTNADLSNFSIIASDQSIQNARVLANSAGTMNKLIDIAPQSLFDYEVNPDSTILISAFSGQNSRGLLSESAVSNGFGRVVTNGFGRVVTNGFGRVVTNGFGRVVTNSYSPDSSNYKLAILIDSLDVYSPQGAEIKSIKGINLITGYTVGTWSLVPGAYISENFDISYGIGSLTITKAPLTITADNKSRFYGSANPALTVSYSGFVNGDNVSSIVAPVVSTTATVSSIAGSYPIKVNGGSSANYSLIKVYGTLTVKKVVLTATADNKSRVYGSANPIFTISYSGFVNGEGTDSLLSLPVASTLATQLSNAGTYSIKVAGGSARSYTINYVSGTLTVTKAMLNATADNKSKTFGNSNPPFTISYSGFLNGDGLANIASAPIASTTATSLSNVGNYPINLSGGSAVNYTFSTTSGILSITPATITLTADNKTINAGAPLPTFTYSIIGFVLGANNSIVSGPQFTVSPAYSGSIGTYSIIASNLGLAMPANYTVNYIDGVLNVTTSNASAKNIEVELECVDTLMDGSGYAYQARFEYENNNCYSVSIPIGSDNSLVGNYSGTQPTTFLPGENHFTIKFDGNPLTWTVKSYANGVKKTSSATATKNSKSCHCHSSRLIAFSSDQNDLPLAESTLSVYPNPAASLLYLTSVTSFSEKPEINIYNMLGEKQAVRYSLSDDEYKVEINVTALLKGVYLIKLNTSSGEQSIRFVKE